MLILFLCCGCAYYPSGMKEYADYIEFNKGFGVLPSFPGVYENPRLVLNESIGIDLILDERVFGTWQSLNQQEIFTISRSGTAQVRMENSTSWRSGMTQMVLHNIIIVYLSPSEFLILKISILNEDTAIFEIVSYNSDVIRISIFKKAYAQYEQL